MNRYIFHNTGSPNTINRPIGPYFTHWVELIGNKLVYTKEDIEKLADTLSATLKKRVLAMREGTCIRLTSIGHYSNISLERLKERDGNLLGEYVKLKEALSEVNADIRKACPPEFLQRKSEIEKDIRKLKKSMAFDVI